MSSCRQLLVAIAVATSALAIVVPSIMVPVAAQTADPSPGKVADSTVRQDHRGTEWVAGWRAAPQQPMSGVSDTGFSNQTVRMVIRARASGDEVRVRLSNAYGTQPVEVGRASIATHTSGPGLAEHSRRPVRFHQKVHFSIPVGEELLSDPVKLKVVPGQDLVVSVFLPESTGPATWHRWAEATSYVSELGDWTGEPGGSPYQTTVPSRFFLDGIDIADPGVAGTVVAFGDSITDGHYATIDGNGRWPDWLARRHRKFSVVNAGIGGNKILQDKSTGGESALHRFNRDVVDVPGVTDVIFLEGINDIAADATAGQVIDAMKQIIETAHSHRLNILGGTLTPWKGSSAYTAERERVREEVNRWIRSSRAFDGVVDFDKAVRSPSDRHVLRPKFDTGGGHIHPNDLGYRAMAAAVDLKSLKGR